MKKWLSTDKKDSHHLVTNIQCDWRMSNDEKWHTHQNLSKTDDNQKFIKFDDFMIFWWFCGNVKNIKKIHKWITVINCYFQQSSYWSNSMKMMNNFDDLVNVFDKLASYWEIRRVSMETMNLIQISYFMTKVIFEEILKESEKMSLQIIGTSFIVLKMMGKSIENNQKEDFSFLFDKREIKIVVMIDFS